MYLAVANISGTGAFPLDMLRYDRCFPISSDDVQMMNHALDPIGFRVQGKRSTWVVQVGRYVKKKGNYAFTPARWESFDCTCTEVDMVKV